MTALADRLVVPRPFQLEEFCAAIARERGRPLRLVPLADAAGADLPCGLWVGLETVDLIFFEAGAAPILKAQIVLHEISHMLLDHVYPEGASLADLTAFVEQAARVERDERDERDERAEQVGQVGQVGQAGQPEQAGLAAAASASAATAADRAADLELGLATDRVLALLARNGYSSRQEADAETLATLILERATRAGADGAAPGADAVLTRLNDALGHPARRS
ncbi:hypothetical protein OG455_20380 [Kitasatospora sp. NBC_01287]|uniref:hypothetical protein n=1 Tax=Kitasatospora sp. NBC_01287 TaxID=2903573 RepID=UPI002259EA16|nr:hypothetical protein [Kitasatospora sp. NBC_01287]MCX4747847.1 hypothetical protein [Kitasatospora sp. NBC_01287]